MKTACSSKAGVVLRLAFGVLMMTSFGYLHFWSWTAEFEMCISVDPMFYEQSMPWLSVVVSDK